MDVLWENNSWKKKMGIKGGDSISREVVGDICKYEAISNN